MCGGDCARGGEGGVGLGVARLMMMNFVACCSQRAVRTGVGKGGLMLISREEGMR
jgi:hypothetical protein